MTDWDDMPTQVHAAGSDQFETLDEAIVAALAELDVGGRLDIHADDCESEDGDEGCTCTPMVLYKGAEA